MSNLDVHFSSKSNEWETPKDLFDWLNNKYNFVYDLAATKENAKCKNFYTEQDDALSKDWYKDIGDENSAFLNPIYGRGIGKFIKKAYDESRKGITIVCLILSRTDTKWFFDYCQKGEITFIKGRLKFINRLLPSWREDGNFKMTPAPFPPPVSITKTTIKI